MFASTRITAVIGVLFFAILAFWPALDKEHKGPARVIDADTLEILGERHRLYGVDAVGKDQTCTRKDGTPWPCGQEAVAALTAFLEGRIVNCDVWRGDTRDAQGRFISVCYSGADDLATWVAREGWAVADPNANRLYNYTSDARMAKFLRKGIWTGSFDPPAVWREAHG
jgi:endonuclease YncB( thermonuclease family)